MSVSFILLASDTRHFYSNSEVTLISSSCSAVCRPPHTLIWPLSGWPTEAGTPNVSLTPFSWVREWKAQLVQCMVCVWICIHMYTYTHKCICAYACRWTTILENQKETTSWFSIFGPWTICQMFKNYIYLSWKPREWHVPKEAHKINCRISVFNSCLMIFGVHNYI